jgi:hypothetical protein
MTHPDSPERKARRTEVLELDLSDSELLHLFKLAHAQDLSLNGFVEQVLTQYIENTHNDLLLNKLDGTNQHGLVP